MSDSQQWNSNLKLHLPFLNHETWPQPQNKRQCPGFEPHTQTSASKFMSSLWNNTVKQWIFLENWAIQGPCDLLNPKLLLKIYYIVQTPTRCNTEPRTSNAHWKVLKLKLEPQTWGVSPSTWNSKLNLETQPRTLTCKACLVVQRANSFTGGRAFDPGTPFPLWWLVLHPSSGIWLAGSVWFSTWLDWFRKIGHLAKIGGGTARTRSTKKKRLPYACRVSPIWTITRRN